MCIVSDLSWFINAWECNFDVLGKLKDIVGRCSVFAQGVGSYRCNLRADRQRSTGQISLLPRPTAQVSCCTDHFSLPSSQDRTC